MSQDDTTLSNLLTMTCTPPPVLIVSTHRLHWLPPATTRSSTLPPRHLVLQHLPPPIAAAPPSLAATSHRFAHTPLLRYALQPTSASRLTPILVLPLSDSEPEPNSNRTQCPVRGSEDW
ncbi:hypothetical protein MVEN_00024900 [Mycena venus]|uniref:Uncharacterized protein n=1 Tax=Mycena venus TaxID=2733690 RepID=A0A8H6Z7C3_9AGAR|nr:hypothetical protein MVEN_00024900 [Mycena venus]